MAKLRSVKGMNDILPADMGRWHRVEAAFRHRAERYGYAEVRTPLLEPTELFVRGIGEVTDIVEKEMYTFEDKGGKTLTLRPEGTASCVRAWLQHSVGGQEPVTKWYYVGPMYRRERPAKGRYRQFHQVGCEIYGDPGPYVDAELIDMVVGFLRELGVLDVEVLVNSLGSGDTRERYREALVAHLEPHRATLSEDSQRRLEANPLRVLDSKAPEDQEAAATAPTLLDFLSDEDRAHFDGVQDTLTALGTPFQVAPRLVRGLDYYTRTLFEVIGRGGDLGAQSTICGGGRYDGMIGDLGGPATPAIGFAMGVERVLLSMPDEAAAAPLDVFVVAEAGVRAPATALARELREAGLRVEADLRGRSLKSQFRRADKSGAPVALVLGEREVDGGGVQLKELGKGTQTSVPRDALVASVREALG